MQSSNNKNMFCRSVTGKGACTARGGVCRYAHTLDELFPVLCRYGDKCARHKDYPRSCKFVHPDQDIFEYATTHGFSVSFTTPPVLKRTAYTFDMNQFPDLMRSGKRSRVDDDVDSVDDVAELGSWASSRSLECDFTKEV